MTQTESGQPSAISFQPEKIVLSGFFQTDG